MLVLPCASVSVAVAEPHSGISGRVGGNGVAEPFVKLLTGETSMADAMSGLVLVSIEV